jgi:hypothetical protein
MSMFGKIVAVMFVLSASVYGYQSLSASSTEMVRCCCGPNCACEVCDCNGENCTNCQCDACDCQGCECGPDCHAKAAA